MLATKLTFQILQECFFELSIPVSNFKTRTESSILSQPNIKELNYFSIFPYAYKENRNIRELYTNSSCLLKIFEVTSFYLGLFLVKYTSCRDDGAVNRNRL